MFAHPYNVCMTYVQHMVFSLEMSYRLAVGSVRAVVHAFLPDCYVTSTTDTMKLIQQRLLEVGCRQESEE